MNKIKVVNPESVRRHDWLAPVLLTSFVLLTALAVTFVLWRNAQQSAERELLIQFDHRVLEITDRLRQRMATYEQVLRGVQGLFVGSEQVGRDEFRHYVEALHLEENYPGIQGLGLEQIVLPANKATFIDTLRQQGLPNYTIHPDGEREMYAPIVFLEPVTERNLLAYGYDVFSEPVRRAAMEQSRDSGKASLSGKLRLIQETAEPKQSGFLMVLPLYRKGMPHTTVDERRANITGWVYEPFRMGDLMAGLGNLFTEELHIQVYDGDEVSAASRMFDSQDNAAHPAQAIPWLKATRKLDVAGHRWTLLIQGLPLFAQQIDLREQKIIATAGTALSMLLTFLVWNLVSQRLRAKALTRKVTRDLHHSEMRFRRVFESNVVGMMFTDFQGQINDANDHFLKLIGYSREDLTNQRINWKALTPEHYRSTDQSAVDTLKREGVCPPWEKEYICKDGTLIPVLISVALLSDSVQQCVCVVLDISERKQAENALRESEERYRSLMENASDAIILTDREGNLLETNKKGLELLGYEKDEIRNLTIAQIHPPELLAIYRDEFEKTAKFGQCQFLDALVLRKDGVIVPVDITGSMIYFGESYLIQGIFRDITERKQAELWLTEKNQQLALANVELARATRLKDEFLANMSHELRTPLNAILGMTEALQERTFGHVNAKQNQALKTIVDAGTHLLELINDILDLAKIEAGKLELNLTHVSITQVSATSLSFVKQQAFKKRLRLESNVQANLPPIIADERRILQVLVNLLNNAVKFTPEGGRVCLEVARLNAASEESEDSLPPGEFVRLAVVDTGIGISPKELGQLFKPFIQIDSALNRQYAGTGLGLALVKRIVELHGGRVDVASEPGVGSRFTVDLPCSATALAHAAPVNPALPVAYAVRGSARHDSAVVLLAEDNEANITTYSNYLTAKGLQVIVAKDGQQAYEIAKSQPPDVILMDIQMPGVDGLESTRLIRGEPSLAHIPIIALTALTMAGDREKCLAAGVSDYVTKPVKLGHLIGIIHQFLSKTNHAHEPDINPDC